MKAVEGITNLHTNDVDRAREFFRFLGLTDVGMNEGWVARFSSPDSDAGASIHFGTVLPPAPHRIGPRAPVTRAKNLPGQYN